MSRVVGTYEKARIWRGEIPGTFEPGYVEAPIIEVGDATNVLRGLGLVGARVFRMGDCMIILGHEEGGVHGEKRWHLTISTPTRHPSWDEIKTARYRLLGPDMVVAMILPPVAFYVNLPEQDHVFQLWQIEDSSRLWENG